MIMGLENSGTAISADSIKTKLLQDVKGTKSVKGASSDTAFYTDGTKTKSKAVRCFRCKRTGHFLSKCKIKLTEQPNTSEQNEKKTVPTQSKAY